MVANRHHFGFASSTSRGRVLPVSEAAMALPIGLARGVRLTRDVAAGEPLGIDDVDLTDDHVCKLHRSSIGD